MPWLWRLGLLRRQLLKRLRVRRIAAEPTAAVESVEVGQRLALVQWLLQMVAALLVRRIG